jgi:Xaa-Pro aminopeptidase
VSIWAYQFCGIAVFTEEDAMKYQDRICRVQEELRKRDLGLLVLTPSANLRYLTGFQGGLMERLTCCLIGRDFARFIMPSFELGALNPRVRELLDCSGWEDGSDPFELAGRLLGDIPARTAAIDRLAPAWVLFGLQAALPGRTWTEADAILAPMREHKDPDEYRCLKTVQAVSCDALCRVIEQGVLGRSEREVAALLKQYSADKGLTDCFAIVASGPNSASPHHRPDDRIICEGDALLIDFGGRDESGYFADTTRTFAVGNKPDGFEEIYHAVLEANQAAFTAAVPGVPCEAVDGAARDSIRRAGYGGSFTHRLGHGLGLALHESPYITQGNRQTIEAGNCFSDEPGIYLPGKFGVRIEDALFIRRDGAEQLTPLGHELQVIG